MQSKGIEATKKYAFVGYSRIILHRFDCPADELGLLNQYLQTVFVIRHAERV